MTLTEMRYIVALARYLVLDMKSLDVWRMLAVAGSMLLLACAVLIIGADRAPAPMAAPLRSLRRPVTTVCSVM